MKGYQPAASFDEDSARRHDHRGDEEGAVAFLERLAKGGPALELAIGTGRIALPLAARGVRVDGIDIAPAMIARLKEKPGGDALSVKLGNFADVDVSGSYSLIFVLWNTMFNLLSQQEQVRCFENVAAHLEEGGSFVVEAYVPTYLHRLPGNQEVRAESVGVDEVRFGLLQHDAATQTIEQSHVSLSGSGVRMTPVVQRYAWPSELDLMARIAGLRLQERWAGWSREPFGSDSEMHVSVYGR